MLKTNSTSTQQALGHVAELSNSMSCYILSEAISFLFVFACERVLSFHSPPVITVVESIVSNGLIPIASQCHPKGTIC